MSVNGTSASPDELDNFEHFSRYQETSNDLGYSITRQSKLVPMAAAPIVPMAPAPVVPKATATPLPLALSGPDRLIFRLEKLFRPTKDLGSILTTFNYGLYLLAYLDAKAHRAKAHALALLTLLTRSPAAAAALAGHPDAEASPFARLGKVVYNARTTLRLFGLLPLYVRARKLVLGSQGMDRVLWGIEAVQCALFAAFQLLENVAFLRENGVLSRRRHVADEVVGAFGTGSARGAGVVRLYRLAHRAWFLGIMCDFARLLRDAQIFFRRKHVDGTDLTPDEVEKAARWYSDWVRPLAWLPIGWQLSAWTEEGMEGITNNLGVQGIAGVLADLRKTAMLWHATKDV